MLERIVGWFWERVLRDRRTCTECGGDLGHDNGGFCSIACADEWTYRTAY